MTTVKRTSLLDIRKSDDLFIRAELARKEIERQELSFDEFEQENGHCDFYTSIELLTYMGR